MNPPSKTQLRQRLLKERLALPLHEHAVLSRRCCDRLYGYIEGLKKPSLVIAGYVPIKGELDITPALAALAGHHPLALPVVLHHTTVLSFRHYAPGDKLGHGAFGTEEPVKEVASLTPDILLVPLLAFNRGGHRLGYGRGYYDATLAHLRKDRSILAIGVAFALQEAALPTDLHDEPLDILITENEIIAP